MEKNTKNKQLDAIDMSKDGSAQRTMMMLVNHIGMSLARHRRDAAANGVTVQMDSSIISALIVAAGCIHGELLEGGVVNDNLDDTAIQLMLIDNFAAGTDAGRKKVQRIRSGQPGCDDPDCRACNPGGVTKH